MYAIIDTETSGLYDYKLPADHPSQPRVAEFAMICIDDDLRFQREVEFLIKPEGWKMTPGASAVNGLTTEQLLRDGVPIAYVLNIYEGAIRTGRAILGYNVRFDTKAMRGEFRHAKRDDLFSLTRNWDVMGAAAAICREAPTDKMMAAGRKTWKTLKLIEAYRILFGKDNGNAHTALGDCRATHDILREIVKRGAKIEPAVHFAENPEGKAAQALAARSGAPAQEENPI